MRRGAWTFFSDKIRDGEKGEDGDSVSGGEVTEVPTDVLLP